jgi:hypothetical protein
LVVLVNSITGRSIVVPVLEEIDYAGSVTFAKDFRHDHDGIEDRANGPLVEATFVGGGSYKQVSMSIINVEINSRVNGCKDEKRMSEASFMFMGFTHVIVYTLTTKVYERMSEVTVDHLQAIVETPQRCPE